MIILITGASHTGKTLLAQRMLEEYGETIEAILKNSRLTVWGLPKPT